MKTKNKSFFAILILLAFFLFDNCKTLQLSSECKEYVSFLKKVWKFDEVTSTYYLEGNPEYWYEPKYFDETCLKGQSRKDIIKLFGNPSIACKYVNFEMLTYCIDEECLLKNKGKRIRFYLDSMNVVGEIYITPPLQKR